MLEGNLPISQVPEIPNTKLENDSITINGSAVALGGSTTIATGLTATEGTFTPTLGWSSTQSTGITYNTQAGRYLKIGNLVWVHVIMYPSAFNGGSGNLRVKDLPYTATSCATAAPIFDRIQIRADKPTTVTGLLDANDDFVELKMMYDGDDENSGFIEIGDCAQNFYLAFSMVYQTS